MTLQISKVDKKKNNRQNKILSLKAIQSFSAALTAGRTPCMQGNVNGRNLYWKRGKEAEVEKVSSEIQNTSKNKKPLKTVRPDCKALTQI